MIGKSPNQNQRDLFNPLLNDFIDKKHELVLLANTIDWSYFEAAFAPLYSKVGQPGMPIRFSVGCLLLKQLYNLGDETLAKAWVMNPYMQYFTGEAKFQHKFPCDPSDFVHFRKRIGELGVEKIFAHTVALHGKDAQTKQMLQDTTVQGNNITFPTDAKLAKQVIERCITLAKSEQIEVRQSYRRVSKQLLRDCHNSNHPRRRGKAKKEQAKLRTIAGRLIRELYRKLSAEQLRQYSEELGHYEKVINQQRHDKDKIYSLHKPFTACIAKGKAHQQYEFGNKIGLMVSTGKQMIVTAIDAFTGNPYDGNTIEPLLTQSKRLHDHVPNEVVYDRGGKVKGGKVNETVISTPTPPLKKDSVYEKRKKRQKFRRRAAIEPVIGHLKHDFRMAQNYLHGKKSPKINAMLSASAWNLKKLMEKLVEQLFVLISLLLKIENTGKFQTMN